MSKFAVPTCKHGCTDECLACYDNEIESLRQQLAECQAREKVIRDAAGKFYDGSNGEVGELTRALKAALALPSDSTALDQAIRQAKREALLEALTKWDEGENVWLVTIVRRMTKELE